MNVLKDRRQFAAEWIRRILTYTDAVTYFGPNSVMRGWAFAVGGLAESAVQQFVGLLRRTTLLAGKGQYLTDYASERGATRYGRMRSKTFVIVQPFKAVVTDIDIGGSGDGDDLIEVNDSSKFAVAMSVRIVNGDGSVTEAATIQAITTGTGPNGGDQLEVSTLSGTYNPTTDDVEVLARVTLPMGTVLTTTSGPSFQTLEAVTSGDRNPVLHGESATLALADKVWAEAVTAGADGNVDPLVISDLQTPVTGIIGIFNPEPASGGSDGETDLELKDRAINRPTLANQETLAWLEAMAREADINMLRALRIPPTQAGVMKALVLKRNGGPFSTAELTAIETYINARVRSYMTTSLGNMPLTAIEVEAEITLDPNVTLQTAFLRASRRLSSFLDFRKWPQGQAVDEADLASLVSQTPGIASMVTSTFLPAADTEVTYLPTLVRLSLRDTVSGDTINAALAQSF